LTGSIRELRRVLPSQAGRGRWFETHPETAFTIMNRGEPLDTKRSGRGVGQRLALLRPTQPVDRLLAEAPPRVPVDDVLDAIAAWWSARRIADGAAEVFGPPGPDDQGFEQSIRV
jgi:predicted RNase H-like nuclease